MSLDIKVAADCNKLHLCIQQYYSFMCHSHVHTTGSICSIFLKIHK